MMQQPSCLLCQSRSTISLTMGRHYPTIPRVPIHAASTVISDTRLSHHVCMVPGPCTTNRNSPVAMTGVDYCVTCFHQSITHMTITRRPKMENEIGKKYNFAKQNSILPQTNLTSLFLYALFDLFCMKSSTHDNSA